MDLRQLYEQEKSIVRFPGWSKPNSSRYIFFDAPLEIGGVIEHGLFLHGGCYENRPDCHVSVALRIAKTSGRSHVELARIDWRPITGGHTNQRHKCESRGRIEGSHVHTFEENFSAEHSSMKSGMPCASALTPDPQSYQGLMGDAGKLFRIKNIDVAISPVWTYDLFSNG